MNELVFSILFSELFWTDSCIHYYVYYIIATLHRCVAHCATALMYDCKNEG